LCAARCSARKYDEKPKKSAAAVATCAGSGRASRARMLHTLLLSPSASHHSNSCRKKEARADTKKYISHGDGYIGIYTLHQLCMLLWESLPRSSTPLSWRTPTTACPRAPLPASSRKSQRRMRRPWPVPPTAMPPTSVCVCVPTEPQEENDVDEQFMGLGRDHHQQPPLRSQVPPQRNFLLTNE
jgi:hypothetical protein